MIRPDPVRIAERLIATFSGRRDAYNTARGGQYVTVREPLTPEVVVVAVGEGRPVGAYFLAPDSTTHVGALDFDSPEGWRIACRVGRAMWGDAVAASVEASRAGRAHLWVTASERLPAVVWRGALRAYEQQVGLSTEDPTIELRPGSDRLYGPESLGHALRLPTMPHPVSGERHLLADPRSGQPLGRSLGEMLLEHQTTPADRLVAAAERYKPKVSEAVRPRGAAPVGDSPIRRFNGTVGVSAVLAREWGILDARPGRTVRCPGHDDRHPSLSIGFDDARAFCRRGQDAYGLWALKAGWLAAPAPPPVRRRWMGKGA